MISVSKTIASDRSERWQWARVSENGSTLETSIESGGYATLAELVADVRARFPGQEIIGIGGDEPEAENLSW